MRDDGPVIPVGESSSGESSSGESPEAVRVNAAAPGIPVGPR